MLSLQPLAFDMLTFAENSIIFINVSRFSPRQAGALTEEPCQTTPVNAHLSSLESSVRFQQVNNISKFYPLGVKRMSPYFYKISSERFLCVAL